MNLSICNIFYCTFGTASLWIFCQLLMVLVLWMAWTPNKPFIYRISEFRLELPYLAVCHSIWPFARSVTHERWIDWNCTVSWHHGSWQTCRISGTLGQDQDSICSIFKNIRTLGIFISENPGRSKARLQPSRWQEMRKMICDIRVDNFMFNPIYFPITWLILNLIFFTLSFNDCQNLQWRLGCVWFLGMEKAVQRHSKDWNYHY